MLSQRRTTSATRLIGAVTALAALAVLATAAPARADEPAGGRDGVVLISATTLTREAAPQTYETTAVSLSAAPQPVTVRSTVPAAQAPVAAHATTGTFDVASGTWTLTLAAGGSATLTLVAL